MPTYAKLRDDLISVPTVIDGQQVYTLKDPITDRYFRLREPEFWLISQLDGNTAPDEVASRFKERFQLNIGAEDVSKFIDHLESLLFLENIRSEQGISRTSYQPAAHRGLAGRILYLKIKAFSPGKFLDLLAALYRPFHGPFWFGVQAIIIVIGLTLLIANADQFGVNIREIYNVSSLAVFVASLFVLVSLHEFAHAVVCKHLGGTVPEMGFLLMYFQPCFYCDLSDAWLFKKKSHRLAVTFAGPYFQLVLLAFAVIIWRLTVPGTGINEIARVIAIISWVSYLFNFNPLIKLDGYYLLSDWLDIPNLRRKSFSYFGNLLQRRFLGWPVEAQEVSRRERRIFISYAVLALIYTGLLLGYILFRLSSFLLAEMGASGLILLLVALSVIFRQGIRDFSHGVIRQIGFAKQIFRKPYRLAAYTTIFLVVIVASLTVPLPHHVSGEVIIQPISRFSLTVNDIGLLESSLRRGGENPGKRSSYLQMASNEMASLDLVPLVQDGQTIKVGDTIAMLTSNQTTRGIASAQAELQTLESELELLKAPPKDEEVAESMAEIGAAQANLDQATRDYERVERLVERKLDTAERLEASRTALNVAKAELANKRSRLELLKSPPRPEEIEVLRHQIQKQKTSLEFLMEQAAAQLIVAPIGGTVTTRTEDEDILRITDDRLVEVTVPVSDFDIGLVRLDQQVSIKIRSFPAREFEGSVIRVPQTAEANDDRPLFPVSVVVKNGDNELQSGMSGYAKIDVGRISLVGLIGRKVTSVLRVEFWSWW